MESADRSVPSSNSAETSFVFAPAEFLPTMPDGQDLDMVLMDFVDDAVSLID
jgi:hypothetical protein